MDHSGSGIPGLGPGRPVYANDMAGDAYRLSLLICMMVAPKWNFCMACQSCER